MNTMVSILVPVYGVERYIEKCVRSLMEQSYEHIEYIFVDDCTPDRSVEILQRVVNEYPHRMNHVKIYKNKKNSGLSASRKHALEKSTGDCFTTVDSDDFLEKEGIERMVECMQQANADVVVSDFIMDYDNNVCRSVQGIDSEEPSSYMKAMMTGEIHGSTCNKLYRRSLVNNVDVPLYIDGANFTEDLGFNLKVFPHAKKVSYLPIAYYHYCIYDNSMSHATIDPDRARKKDLQKVVNIQDVSRYLDVIGYTPRVEKELNYCKLIAKMPFLAVVNKRSCLRWCAIFPEANKAIWENDRLPLTYKLELQLLRIKWINLFVWIQNLKIKLAKR